MITINKRFKTVISLTVLLLIITVPFLQLIQAADPTELELKNKASFLVSTLKNANQSITQTISNLKAIVITIPQPANDAFREAQTLANQAIDIYQQGKYAMAIDLAMRALQKIKETLKLLNGLADEAAQDGNYERDRIQNKINRQTSILQRFEIIATSAANHGIDLSAIRPKLSRIKTNLDSAIIDLNQGNLQQAATQIAQTQTLINELSSYFTNLATSLNIEKVSAYITRAESDLAALKQQVTSSTSNLSPNTRAAVSATITQAQTSLDNAKQYLSNQQITQTIDELKTVQASQEAVKNYINSDSTATPTKTPTMTPAPNNVLDSTRATATSTNKLP